MDYYGNCRLFVNAQRKSLSLRIPLVYVNKSAVSCEIPITKYFIFQCVKNVYIRRFFVRIFRSFSAFPYFLSLNTEIYIANLRIQSKWGKMYTRKTLNADRYFAGIVWSAVHHKSVFTISQLLPMNMKFVVIYLFI